MSSRVQRISGIVLEIVPNGDRYLRLSLFHSIIPFVTFCSEKIRKQTVRGSPIYLTISSAPCLTLPKVERSHLSKNGEC